MILFWVICALFIVIALAFVLPPALQRSSNGAKESDEERRHANIAVYRDQLSELESDLRNGIVSQTQYQQDREEIERRLLEDTTQLQSRGKQTKAVGGNRNTAYVLAFGIPLVAVVFYAKIGDPKSLTNPSTPAATSAPSGIRTAVP